jgi:bifunctional DNA-binding transcriptional regulator/antitoxin component of YhaV-PrlF toxin-antitoxin module
MYVEEHFMKLIEIERKTNPDGQLILPADLLKIIGILPGENIRLAYAAPDPVSDSNTYKRFFLAPGKTYADFELTLPHDLLEAAEIPEDSDLEVICARGAVIVTAGDILESLPDDLRELFADIGINPETVRNVMRSGEFDGDE